MDAVVAEVVRVMTCEVPKGYDPELREDVAENMITEFNAAQIEYAPYPWKKRPRSGTLCWEFSKKLIHTYNPENDAGTLFVNLTVVSYATNFLKLLTNLKT